VARKTLQKSIRQTLHLGLPQRAYLLAITAAILYCSWPLGYLLNPVVTHRHGLASELGAAGQPYSWLFDWLDITTCLLIFGVVYILTKVVDIRDWWVRAVLIGYGAFAVLTILDAVVPLNCLPSSGGCGDVLHNPLIVLHGAMSVSASLALFISAICCWVLAFKSEQRRFHQIMYAILWSYMLFGAISFVFLFVNGPGYLSQDYFITLTSIWIALLPFAVIQLTKKVEVKTS